MLSSNLINHLDIHYLSEIRVDCFIRNENPMGLIFKKSCILSLENSDTVIIADAFFAAIGEIRRKYLFIRYLWRLEGFR